MSTASLLPPANPPGVAGLLEHKPPRPLKVHEQFPNCRHCGEPVTRPRGLCWSCYYSPGIRKRYPSTSAKGQRRGDKPAGVPRPLPSKPTMAEPGSQEKMRVLRGRARRNERLWHPLDARPWYEDREPPEVPGFLGIMRPTASPEQEARELHEEVRQLLAEREERKRLRQEARAAAG